MDILFLLHDGCHPWFFSTLFGIDPQITKIVSVSNLNDSVVVDKIITYVSDHLLRSEKNRLPIVQKLHEQGNHLCIKLDDLVSKPLEVFDRVSKFTGLLFNRDKFLEFHAQYASVIDKHEAGRLALYTDRTSFSFPDPVIYSPIAEVTPVNEPVPEPPIEELFQPSELTVIAPLPQPLRPEKTLFLVEKYLIDDLLGTLFTKTGKSLKTTGKNPLVVRSDDLEEICRSDRKYGLLTTDKLEDWDAPDILDEFCVVVYSDKSTPLPSCEGLDYYLSFSNLSELQSVYEFLGLKDK